MSLKGTACETVMKSSVMYEGLMELGQNKATTYGFVDNPNVKTIVNNVFVCR